MGNHIKAQSQLGAAGGIQQSLESCHFNHSSNHHHYDLNVGVVGNWFELGHFFWVKTLVLLFHSSYVSRVNYWTSQGSSQEAATSDGCSKLFTSLVNVIQQSQWSAILRLDLVLWMQKRTKETVSASHPHPLEPAVHNVRQHYRSIQPIINWLSIHTAMSLWQFLKQLVCKRTKTF